MTQIPKDPIFTPEQVVDLNRYQRAREYHPYTCPYRGDGKHRVFNGDLGALVATVRGWICPFCDYTQGWAHGVVPIQGSEDQQGENT